MNDFDAKNHLRDLRRAADNERLAQLIMAQVEADKPKATHGAFLSTVVRLLTWMFTQTRRQSG